MSMVFGRSDDERFEEAEKTGCGRAVLVSVQATVVPSRPVELASRSCEVGYGKSLCVRYELLHACAIPLTTPHLTWQNLDWPVFMYCGHRD